MRIAELMGSDVVDSAGVRIGVVDDVRLVQDGPYVEGFGSALRVDALVVGTGSMAVRLGYHRHTVSGPWLLKRLFVALEGRAGFVEWRDVASWDGGTVRLRISQSQVQRLSTAA